VGFSDEIWQRILAVHLQTPARDRDFQIHLIDILLKLRTQWEVLRNKKTRKELGLRAPQTCFEYQSWESQTTLGRLLSQAQGGYTGGLKTLSDQIVPRSFVIALRSVFPHALWHSQTILMCPLPSGTHCDLTFSHTSDAPSRVTFIDRYQCLSPAPFEGVVCLSGAVHEATRNRRIWQFVLKSSD
jgi:hypothetical protein